MDVKTSAWLSTDSKNFAVSLASMSKTEKKKGRKYIFKEMNTDSIDMLSVHLRLVRLQSRLPGY